MSVGPFLCCINLMISALMGIGSPTLGMCWWVSMCPHHHPPHEFMSAHQLVINHVQNPRHAVHASGFGRPHHAISMS